MENIDLAELDDCHNVLLQVYDRIENKENYALPYLVMPTSSFSNSEYRILIVGKETYGWGNKEMERDDWRIEDCKSNLIKLYDEIANVKWGTGTGSRYWGFVRKLKKQIENITSINNSPTQRNKVGILSANTCLIGYKYGTTGFNPELIREGENVGLEKAFELLYKSLKPHVIILTIGGNLSNGYVKNYLRIVHSPLQLDINDIASIDLTPEKNNRKIVVTKVQSQLQSAPHIFITPHPGGCKQDILVNYLETQILRCISELTLPRETSLGGIAISVV